MIVEVLVHAFSVEEDSRFFIATGAAWGLYNAKFCREAYLARKQEMLLRRQGLGDWEKRPGKEDIIDSAEE